MVTWTRNVPTTGSNLMAHLSNLVTTMHLEIAGWFMDMKILLGKLGSKQLLILYAVILVIPAILSSP